MKKLFVLFVGSLLTTLVFAQGTFDFQNALPDWFDSNFFSQNGNTRTGTRYESRTEDGKNYNCTIEDMNLTQTPEKIITFAPDVGVLYPSNLLQGKATSLGSLYELPIPTDRRNGVTLSIDLPMQNSSRRINQPSLATIRDAINDLRFEAQRQGVVSPANYDYKSFVQYSADQVALQLGLDLRFLPVNVRASARLSSKKRTVTAFFIQKAFSVSVDLGGTKPSQSLFASNFREDEYRALETNGAISKFNAPTYVSSVTYGRIMMFSLTYEATETQLQAAISAWGAGASGQYRQILQSAELKVTTLGGTEDAAKNAILYADPRAYFTSNAPLSSMVPISYELRTVKENQIAALKQTTNYSIEKCQESVTAYQVSVTLESVSAIRDCDPGIFEGAGDFSFSTYIQGNFVLYEITRPNNIQIDDGRTIQINQSAAFRVLVGQSFTYSGIAYEGDDSILGSSTTTVGSFIKTYTLTGNALVDNRRETVRIGRGDCQFEFNFRFDTSPL